MAYAEVLGKIYGAIYLRKCFEKREFWPENGFMNLSVKAEYLCMHLCTQTRSNSYGMTCLLFKSSLQNERNNHGIICKGLI